MCGSIDEWDFDNKVAGVRRKRLLSVPSFESIVRRVANEMQIVGVGWELGNSSELEGCWRPYFFFTVEADTFDDFYNSPQGYRGRTVWRTMDEGRWGRVRGARQRVPGRRSDVGGGGLEAWRWSRSTVLHCHHAPRHRDLPHRKCPGQPPRRWRASQSAGARRGVGLQRRHRWALRCGYELSGRWQSFSG